MTGGQTLSIEDFFFFLKKKDKEKYNQRPPRSTITACLQQL